MNFLISYIFFLFLTLATAADETTSSSSSSATGTVRTTTSVSTTFVWVTGTDASGNLATTQSPYYQSFESFWTEVASPSSGSIGIGTISGSVGGIREYSQTTVSQGMGSSLNKRGGNTCVSDLRLTKLLGASTVALISLVLLI
ncbi:Protein KRE1 [Candida viswanathii]|uniref:Protein KRE1 n=1 Tax=Candida viswanathii TaxID=5486 RepID=A0A367Y0E0_9ASCO|nr:Protein KRE1 [Candida viswanathii]